MPFASWSVVTVDFLVVLHLALGGVTLAALLHLVNAKWRYDIRYLSASFFALFPLAFCLLILLLLRGSATFPWVGSFEPLPSVFCTVCSSSFRPFQRDPPRRRTLSGTLRCAYPSPMCCSAPWSPGTLK